MQGRATSMSGCDTRGVEGQNGSHGCWESASHFRSGIADIGTKTK